MTIPSLRSPMSRVLAALLPLLAAGCDKEQQPDAYGNFEAEEVVVSAEMPGLLLRFDAEEGEQLAAGALVAIVDTTQLSLEREQLATQKSASSARAASVASQVSALELQRDQASRDYERARSLLAGGAIATRDLEQAEREWRTLAEQVEGMRAQARSAGADVRGIDARVALLAERIAKSRVTNPLAGTVLATYADAGEYVQPGQPLYKIAALDTLVLRAYVAEPQLAVLRLGEPVDVRVDDGPGARTVRGVVSWIASKAEFTPTPVQTRDARADLVYAVKILVPNADGALKIGMPADVTLGGGTTSTTAPDR